MARRCQSRSFIIGFIFFLGFFAIPEANAEKFTAEQQQAIEYKLALWRLDIALAFDSHKINYTGPGFGHLQAALAKQFLKNCGIEMEIVSTSWDPVLRIRDFAGPGEHLYFIPDPKGLTGQHGLPLIGRANQLDYNVMEATGRYDESAKIKVGEFFRRSDEVLHLDEMELKYKNVGISVAKRLWAGCLALIGR